MELLLTREPSSAKCTLGELTLDGLHLCWTLEDIVREVPGVQVEDWKVFGETAIGVGRYPVTLETSGRFGPNTMTVGNVRGFSYIRIHPGNTRDQTDGCLLLGEGKGVDSITNSRAAVEKVKGIVKAAIDGGESVYITIR